jgi:hypothetical protein
MRKVLLLIALVLFPTVVFAQPKQTVSVFLSGVNRYSQDAQWPAGFGIAYERMVAQRVSLDAAVAYERHWSYPYVVDEGGFINIVPRVHLQTMPIDLTVNYHWLNDTRWKPYLGGGAHYVAAPHVHLDPGFRYQDHVNSEVDGGVVFMLTRSAGVMLDGRVIGGDRETYDPVFKISAGLSWRF